MIGNALLALGSNMPGPWGVPCATLDAACRWLIANGVTIVRRSPLYHTPPQGTRKLMRWFTNQVIEVRTGRGRLALLHLVKRAEREAGRRQRGRWTSRPLDIDVLMHGSGAVNWGLTTSAGSPLSLPHPLLHQRGFVLVPLDAVAPRWRHPVLGVTARQFLVRHPALRRGITAA